MKFVCTFIHSNNKNHYTQFGLLFDDGKSLYCTGSVGPCVYILVVEDCRRLVGATSVWESSASLMTVGECLRVVKNT